MKLRLIAAFAVLSFAAPQGGEAWALPRTHRHAYPHHHHAPRVTPPRVVVVPRVVPPRIVVVRTVQVIPRVVYLPAPIPYTPLVAYQPAPYASQPVFSPQSSYAYSPPTEPQYAASAYPTPAPAAALPVPESGGLQSGSSAPSAIGPYSVEQAIQYRFFCPDVRLYYPEIKECPAGWLTVLPGNRKPPG